MKKDTLIRDFNTCIKFIIQVIILLVYSKILGVFWFSSNKILILMSILLVLLRYLLNGTSMSIIYGVIDASKIYFEYPNEIKTVCSFVSAYIIELVQIIIIDYICPDIFFFINIEGHRFVFLLMYAYILVFLHLNTITDINDILENVSKGEDK